MSSRLFLDRARGLPASCLGVIVLLTLGACGEKDGNDGTGTTTAPNANASNTESNAGSHGGTGGTTAPTAGDPAASGSGTSTTSSAPNTGGTKPSTSGSATTPNGSGTSSGTPTGTGGADDPGSTGEGGTGTAGESDDPSADDPSADDPSPDDPGDDPSSGDPSSDDPSSDDPGGEPSSGGEGGEGGGTANEGTGGTGEPSSGECTRELLDGLLDDYFAALSAGDPSTLPLAADVKFTENAEVTEIGTTAFWMNAGDTKYSQRALDTTACGAAAEAVIPEGTTDLVVALRIKAVAGELTEIETIVFREGDYTASFSVPSNPQAIIDIADEIGWHDEVPEGDRATREELAAWIDKYFRAFPAGVCNVTDDCRRLENGGGNFSCGAGASCSGSTPTSGGTFEPRVTVVDEVRGIAAGFTIFDFQADGHLDMHMVKMSGGEVHAVHAILRDTEGQSGWE